jgi:hypothetical protein
MYAVSAAGVLAGELADGDGLGEDGPDGDAGADGEAESDGEADGDALGDADPASLGPWPVTVWPGAIVAGPVVTSVREPTAGGARSGAGAWCPLGCPVTVPACVAEAGT